jgi:hypothetical protein
MDETGGLELRGSAEHGEGFLVRGGHRVLNGEANTGSAAHEAVLDLAAATRQSRRRWRRDARHRQVGRKLPGSCITFIRTEHHRPKRQN